MDKDRAENAEDRSQSDLVEPVIEDSTSAPVVRSNELSPLASVPFHDNQRDIRRLAPADFPVHVAIHHVNGVEETPREYVTRHSHDFPEVNILLGPKGAMTYDVLVGEKIRRLTSPATVWIPPKVEHNANVVRGSGIFICLILADTARAFPNAGDASLRWHGWVGNDQTHRVPVWLEEPISADGNPLEFPIYVAAHDLSDGQPLPNRYLDEHTHDVPEVNLVLGPPGAITCRYTLDGDSEEVASPASVWIPPEVPHAIRRVQGSGTFLTVVMTDPKRAFGSSSVP